MHCVFATHERRPLIKSYLQQRLWRYLGGIARESRMMALVVGGVQDHVHILLSIPATLSVAKSSQLLKGNSSEWIHDTFTEHWDFEWQEGYGAFSIGISGLEDTTKYILSYHLLNSDAILLFPQPIEPVSARRSHAYRIVDHTGNRVPGTRPNLGGRFENVAGDTRTPRKRDARAGP